MSLLEKLNDEQRAAASCIEGPILVLAGAGSGKTRTLTHRIGHMVLEKDIPASSILAITFTNKAAKEMKSRVNKLLGRDEVFISTFHSFGVKMLRKYITVLGMSSNFNIYDMDDQKKLISQILKKFAVDIVGTPSKLVSRIGRMKELGITPDSMDIKSSYDKKLSDLFSLYQKELAINNAIDFTDILTYTAQILDNEEVLKRVQNRFKYIMVDEYQDTNPVQYKIVNKIAQKNNNVFVVGDENQGIYSFRGADINNILNFEHDYPNAKVFNLEKNYRSTSNIIEAANHIIKNNSTSLGKNLWTENDAGEKVLIHETEDSRREARKIVKLIRALNKQEEDYKTVTILYRNNFQAREIEEELIRMCIPYKVYGGMQFYQRKEIKDMLAYLILSNNINDKVSFQRVINFPQRGIGQITLDKLLDICMDNQCNVIEALNIALESDNFSTNIKKTLHSFRDMILSFNELIEHESVANLLEIILNKSGILEYFKENEEEDRIKNIKELINASKAYDGVSVEEFLERVALTSATDKLEDDDNHVKLMTIHNSKGLEFDNVFLVGVEEDVFPNSSAIFEDKIQEERRLFYVAITRARKRLFVTYSRSRMLYDAETRFREKSRFIEELPEEVIEYEKVEENNKKNSEMLFKAIADMKKRKAEAKRVIESENRVRIAKLKKIVGFSLGDKVQHKAFGHGKIVSMNLDKVIIAFDEAGEKKFLSSTVSKFISKL